MSELTDASTGRWSVLTESSWYWVYMDERRLMRLPPLEDVTGPRAELRMDKEWIPLLSVVKVCVGEPACFLIDVRGDGASTFRMTTPVLAVLELGPRRASYAPVTD